MFPGGRGLHQYTFPLRKASGAVSALNWTSDNVDRSRARVTQVLVPDSGDAGAHGFLGDYVRFDSENWDESWTESNETAKVEVRLELGTSYLKSGVDYNISFRCVAHT